MKRLALVLSGSTSALAGLRCAVYGCAMSNAATETAGGVQSVDRALRILEILARSGESGVTEIAAALEVHKSTAFRLVATLEQHGLVEQVEGRGKYRLGVGLLRLAGATSARLDVVQEARPLCKQLAAATGETVNLATLSGNSALYLDQVAGPSALQPHNWVGQHIPLHATSNGKVLMAWLSRCRSARPARPAAGVHRTDDHHEGQAQRRSSRPCASAGTPSRWTSSRSA